MATLPAILIKEVQWTEEPGMLLLHGVAKSPGTTEDTHSRFVIAYLPRSQHL